MTADFVKVAPEDLILDGAFNFRDLGGLPVSGGGQTRPGLLFRSDTLQAITPSDVERLANQIGLRSVVDLRLADEVAQEGRGLLGLHQDIRFTHAPMGMAPTQGVAPDEILDVLYRSCLASDSMVMAIEQIALNAGQPTLFHCAAGKDRTGLVAAMLLSLAGVDTEAIVADYLRSAHAMPRMLERFASWPRYRDHMAASPPQVYAVTEAPIRRFLDELALNHGGAWVWAKARGLPATTLERFVRTLLGPGS
jgi:protein-tyrosine phosphatase